MIEKLLVLAAKTANCKLHFFVPFNFGVYSFLFVLQILIKLLNTSTWMMSLYPFCNGTCSLSATGEEVTTNMFSVLILFVMEHAH